MHALRGDLRGASVMTPRLPRFGDAFRARFTNAPGPAEAVDGPEPERRVQGRLMLGSDGSGFQPRRG